MISSQRLIKPVKSTGFLPHLAHRQRRFPSRNTLPQIGLTIIDLNGIRLSGEQVVHHAFNILQSDKQIRRIGNTVIDGHIQTFFLLKQTIHAHVIGDLHNVFPPEKPWGKGQ